MADPQAGEWRGRKSVSERGEEGTKEMERGSEETDTETETDTMTGRFRSPCHICLLPMTFSFPPSVLLFEIYISLDYFLSVNSSLIT